MLETRRHCRWQKRTIDRCHCTQIDRRHIAHASKSIFSVIVIKHESCVSRSSCCCYVRARTFVQVVFLRLDLCRTKRTDLQFLRLSTVRLRSCRKRLFTSHCAETMLYLLICLIGKSIELICRHRLVSALGLIQSAATIQCYTCNGPGFLCSLPLDVDAGDESNEGDVSSPHYAHGFVCQVRFREAR